MLKVCKISKLVIQLDLMLFLKALKLMVLLVTIILMVKVLQYKNG
ncbi:Uncharacterised protein [Aeromonas hydrophila]|nr:Uncharacterised protein [Aeromonas hydrophila]